jgi:hypothetical protein
MRKIRIALIFFLATFVPAMAGEETVTKDTLLDRIMIEDMLIKYYVDISSGSGHNLSQNFTEDAVFDVNGMIAKGLRLSRKCTGDWMRKTLTSAAGFTCCLIIRLSV